MLFAALCSCAGNRDASHRTQRDSTRDAYLAHCTPEIAEAIRLNRVIIGMTKDEAIHARPDSRICNDTTGQDERGPTERFMFCSPACGCRYPLTVTISAGAVAKVE